MIKYYCDICGKEITDGKVFARFYCSVVPGYSKDIQMELHKECAINFIGKQVIADMQTAVEKRKKEREERKKVRADNAE